MRCALRSGKVGLREAEAVEKERRDDALLAETSDDIAEDEVLQRRGDGLREASWSGRTALVKYETSERCRWGPMDAVIGGEVGREAGGEAVRSGVPGVNPVRNEVS